MSKELQNLLDQVQELKKMVVKIPSMHLCPEHAKMAQELTDIKGETKEIKNDVTILKLDMTEIKSDIKYLRKSHDEKDRKFEEHLKEGEETFRPKIERAYIGVKVIGAVLAAILGISVLALNIANSVKNNAEVKHYAGKTKT